MAELLLKNLVDSAILLSDKKIPPRQFEIRHIKKRFNEINSKINHRNIDLKSKLNDSIDKNVSVVSIPYHGNLSEILKRFLRKYNVKVVSRINSK